MNLIRIDKDNMVNGPGIRQVLWFSSCSHHCPGCHNPETWDPNCGHLFTEEDKEKIFNLCDNDYTSGITLTGGDPFHPNNREELAEFASEFEARFPGQTIWCWTGYNIQNILNEELLQYIDVLIDGKFDKEQRELDLQRENSTELLQYRGSSNQRIIDVQKTLKNNSVVLYDPK